MRRWLRPALLAREPGCSRHACRANYPSRPIRMLLPQAPGSTTDTVGRIVFAATAERLGQQLVVDNRPGAGGTIGMEIASRAVPDGYTLVGVAASMMAITPHVYRKLAYDPLRDFVPVGMFILSQIAVCVHDKLPPKIGAGAGEAREGQARASSTWPPRASARRATWAASCSRRSPASPPTTCRTRAARPSRRWRRENRTSPSRR